MLTVQDSTLDFPIWLLFQLGFLDALVMIVELKLTGYLSEPGVCVSTVWAQNGKKDCYIVNYAYRVLKYVVFF